MVVVVVDVVVVDVVVVALGFSHRNEPFVFRHSNGLWQLCRPNAHSSSSLIEKVRNKNVIKQFFFLDI